MRKHSVDSLILVKDDNAEDVPAIDGVDQQSALSPLMEQNSDTELSTDLKLDDTARSN